MFNIVGAISNGKILFYYVFYADHEVVNKRSYRNISQTDIAFTKVENLGTF